MNQLQTILVVGGAGYIGSHMVKTLAESGYRPVVLDDLSAGRREAVGGHELLVGDAGDKAFVAAAMERFKPAAVMHFASFIEVGESVRDPGKYYLNNVCATLALLDSMREAGVDAFIFSSTAAIFGNPEFVPINESHPCNPVNPYGRSKWMVEQVLDDYEHAYGLRSICLRYFNAAGGDPEFGLGECHEPETHLIPLILQVAGGRREDITIFGDDYDTPDGTCIRDYIHVRDLCQAHLLALRSLLSGGPGGRYNLGNGTGFSVKEVVEVAREVTGHPVPVRVGPRRSGDPGRLVADSTLARARLGWQPERTDLNAIVGDAWRWEQVHFNAGAPGGSPSPRGGA